MQSFLPRLDNFVIDRRENIKFYFPFNRHFRNFFGIEASMLEFARISELWQQSQFALRMARWQLVDRTIWRFTDFWNTHAPSYSRLSLPLIDNADVSRKLLLGLKLTRTSSLRPGIRYKRAAHLRPNRWFF
jgi:hypothetical protein